LATALSKKAAWAFATFSAFPAHVLTAEFYKALP
jgi:hypothetical protein